MPNILFRQYNIDSSTTTTTILMRGLYNELEFIDNVLDSNIGSCRPNTIGTNGGLTDFVADSCLCNLVIRNNFILWLSINKQYLYSS